jgi:hypothetical protein
MKLPAPAAEAAGSLRSPAASIMEAPQLIAGALALHGSGCLSMLINWFGVFDAVCSCANGALEWGLPEPWVHAELYAELKREANSSGWRPIPKEVPYVTFYPVCLPRKTNRDWKSEGAVKWVDLCLHHESENAWCWFEFKVRHTGEPDRQRQAANEARDAFRKDVIALVGFDRVSTAKCWEQPDKFTGAFWFDSLLKPKAPAIRSGKHSFVSAYLQLDGQLDSEAWSEETFKREIRSWFTSRCEHSSHKRNLPNINITYSSHLLVGRHSLLICEWASEIHEDSQC